VSTTSSTDVEIRRIDAARQADLLASFAPLHYRAGTPATFAQVLGAFDATSNQPRCVGVLCVSRPTLNGPWRARAWPDLFGGHAPRSPRDLARTLNLYVRTISRVIVHPSFRGVGVASRLVRTYLDFPLTPLTETLAAMGRVSPLFQCCGMREVICPRSCRDRRLLRALHVRVLRPLDLVSLNAATLALRADPSLAHEVLTWTRASRSTRGREPDAGNHDAVAKLLVLASAGLIARPLVLVTP
jgi:GNAT superfamily N-acetyltransferase